LFRCDSNRLRSFLDDELDDVQRSDLAEHLEDCPSCQAKLERLAAASKLWRALGMLGAGESNSRVLERTGEFHPAGRESRAEADDEPIDFLDAPGGPGHIGKLGAYEINEVLGRGGMGIVLKAFDPSLGRVVAIKVLAPQLATSGAARKRFAREARAAAAVVHEHVIAIHAVDSWNGLPYLVMPYIAGRSLQDRIDRDGPLAIKEVLRIGMQAALGLAAAHEQGLVHRDVKPSNILLENGLERVWLTDFGLARTMDDASLTHSGVVAGTPQYMAPEQARGEPFDHRADLFSLGSVLYAMSLGHPPFRAENTLAVLRRVSEERPRPLRQVDPEIPAWLEEIVSKLHARNPADRYQTAGQVAEVLGNRLAGLQRPQLQSGHAQSKARPSERTSARPRIKRPVVLGVAIAVLAALAWANRSSLDDVKSVLLASAPQSGTGAAAGSPVQNAESDVIVGSGTPATRELKLADFDNVQIRHPFQVQVKRTDGFNVSVTADDNVIPHVKAEKVGSRLEISLEDGKTYRLKKGSLKVNVGMPSLADIGASHGARVRIEGFRSDRPFQARATHGSTLDGEIEAGDVTLNVSHGSTLDLKGKARKAELSASHGGTLHLAELACGAIEVTAMHGATAVVSSRSAEHFQAQAAHGGTIHGSVEARDIHVEAQHGASVHLDGKGQTATLSGGFGCRLALGGLALDRAEVQLAHAGSATVNAREALDYRLSFGSTLKYVGKPAIGRSDATRDSKARSIEASAAIQEQPVPPRQPSRRAASEQGEMVITTRGGPGTHAIQIGDPGAAAIVGSGKPATRQVEVSGFQQVHADLPCLVEIVRDSNLRVSFTADDNIVEHLKAIKDATTLKLELEKGSYQLRAPLTARIAMPSLAGLRLDGAAHAKIEGFDSHEPFHARLDGASSLEGSIKAGDIEIECNGAGRATLQGGATALKLKASGASHLELGELTAGSVDATLDGASHATVHASEQLSYSAQGVSHLEYAGDPKIQQARKDRLSSVTRRH
jgi:serine/threonine-protein kinase